MAWPSGTRSIDAPHRAQRASKERHVGLNRGFAQTTRPTTSLGCLGHLFSHPSRSRDASQASRWMGRLDAACPTWLHRPMSLRVEVIGGACIARAASVAPLERKAAALLTYVALSGSTARTRIAGLLWPESPERTARNNLAQTIRRLSHAAGRSLFEGDAAIVIERDVEVDAVRLEVLVQ